MSPKVNVEKENADLSKVQHVPGAEVFSASALASSVSLRPDDSTEALVIFAAVTNYANVVDAGSGSDDEDKLHIVEEDGGGGGCDSMLPGGERHGGDRWDGGKIIVTPTRAQTPPPWRRSHLCSRAFVCCRPSLAALLSGDAAAALLCGRVVNGCPEERRRCLCTAQHHRLFGEHEGGSYYDSNREEAAR